MHYSSIYCCFFIMVLPTYFAVLCIALWVKNDMDMTCDISIEHMVLWHDGFAQRHQISTQTMAALSPRWVGSEIFLVMPKSFCCFLFSVKGSIWTKSEYLSEKRFWTEKNIYVPTIVRFCGQSRASIWMKSDFDLRRMYLPINIRFCVQSSIFPHESMMQLRIG